MVIVSISLAIESWLLSLHKAQSRDAKSGQFPKASSQTTPSGGNSRCLVRKTILSVMGRY
jgi:hypothetical protein